MKIRDWLQFIGFIVIIILGMSVAFSLVMGGFAELQESGHPLINSTVIFNQSNSLGYIDSNGNGYRLSIEYGSCFPFKILIFGDTYNITYFCDSDGYRELVSADDLTVHPIPTITPDPFKCVNLSGVCQ